MRKDEKRLKCTLLNGSAGSTEKKYIGRYRGTLDIFSGIEHRLRKEEVEEQLNKEAKEGWRFAAGAARITDERAGSHDQKHQEEFCGSRQQSGSSCWREREGAVMSIPGNEGRMAHVWVKVRGGMRMFAPYFWYTEGRSPRNEAILEMVLKRGCDANMSPEDFEKSLWFRKDQMHVTTPEGVSTCRSKMPKGNG